MKPILQKTISGMVRLMADIIQKLRGSIYCSRTLIGQANFGAEKIGQIDHREKVIWTIGKIEH